MGNRILLTVLCMLIAGFTVAQEEVKGTYDDLARKVEKKIRDNKKTDIQDLKVTNDQGTIYLEGIAEVYGSKYLSEKIARKVEGVKDVKEFIALRSTQADDVEIEAKVTNKIRSHLTGSPFDLIGIRVHSGFVVLTGNVRDQTLIEDSLESAMWVPGVRGVENRIEYASIAAGDERLRQVIYNRIRREYPQYFVGKDPRILIIVNSGRVQLIGSVESNAGREKLGSMVRSINGVLSVDNQLVAN